MAKPATIRELNRLRVVDTLRREGHASRSDLSRLTGLSRTTVAGLVADLHRQGLVVENESAEEPAAPGTRGRPPVVLRLAVSAGAAVGVDFGHGHVRVAVADLVSQALGEARIDRSRVLGAGIGVPAPIDRVSGRLRSSSILPGWAGLDLARELGLRLGLPVAIENDANLGALAEVSFGAGREHCDVVYVRCERGIGAGLVLGGALYRGAAGLAGELGHVQVRPEGAVCRCGSRGCLETVAATGALLAALEPAHGPGLTLGRLLELVATGDPGATRVVNDAGRAVGRVLADLTNHLNPSAIIVGGELGRAAEPLLAGIRESVDRYAQPSAADAVEVRLGVLAERAEVLGALALVIRDTDRIASDGLPSLRGDASSASLAGAGL